MAAVSSAFLAIGVGEASAGTFTVALPANGAAYNTPQIDYGGQAESNHVIGTVTGVRCYGEGGIGVCLPYFYIDSEFTNVIGKIFTVPASGGGVQVDQFSVELDDNTVELGRHVFGWNYDSSVSLADGRYRVSAFHLDNDGEQGVENFFVIDTTAPNTQLNTPPPNLFSNDTAPEFNMQGTDPESSPGVPGSGIDRFECRLDGAVAWTVCTPSTTFNTPEGNHTIQVRAVDKAGNADPTPASYSWMVDTTPPNVTIAGLPAKSRFLLHATINPTFSCSDPLSSGVRSGLKPDGAISSSGAPHCVANSIDNETLGPHEFRVQTEDRAGNATTNRIAYVIDPPRYGDFVLDDDPLAYYRLNDAVGSSGMLDSSGNDHHGEVKDTNPSVSYGRTGAIACARRPHPPRACELAADLEDKAAYFPGRDGYGFVNGIAAPTHSYTMEAWVKPRSNGAMMIMGHGGGGQLYRQANNRLALRQTQDTVADTNASGFATIDTGVWTHVAASWDGNTTRLFVNGVLVETSNAANKPPSGTSTFYVGYGESAPWFHGDIDEAAYYDHAVDPHRIGDRHKIGTAKDNPSIAPGNSPLNTEGPFTDPVAPKNGGLYAPGKTPLAEFTCTDPDDTAPFPAAGSDIASCTATVQKTSPPAGPITPITNGTTLPDAPGTYTFTVTAVDKGANPPYVHPHTYEVRPFKDIYLNSADGPIAYYRLGDGAGATQMADATGDHDGEYKNGQTSNPFGVSGDGDRARDFFGADGYGYANGIAAPRHQSTLEAWVDPDDPNRRQSIVGHGDAGEIYLQNGTFRFRHMGETVNAGVGVGPNPYTQVVGTWDGVDLRIYVDGLLKNTLESPGRPTSVSTFYVGFGEIAPWFDGRLDEIAYYSTALNANRVYQHFLADPPAEGGGDTGGTDGGGSTGGGDQGGGDQGGGETGGADSGDASIGEESLPAGEDPGEPSGEDPETSAELQKCLKRAYKIGNKKKRHKAVKKCRANHGATA